MFCWYTEKVFASFSQCGLARYISFSAEQASSFKIGGVFSLIWSMVWEVAVLLVSLSVFMVTEWLDNFGHLSNPVFRHGIFSLVFLLRVQALSLGVSGCRARYGGILGLFLRHVLSLCASTFSGMRCMAIYMCVG